MSIREEEGNGFKMNEGGQGGGWSGEKPGKEGKSDFRGGPARLQSLLSTTVSGQRLLRPLVSGWRSAPARCSGDPRAARPRDQLEKPVGQMPFLLFTEEAEVEIALAFSTLQSKERFWYEERVLWFLRAI